MPTGIVDLETQSECELSHKGGRNYAQDPSTRILCLVGIIDGRLTVWINATWPRVNVPWPQGWEKRDYDLHIGSVVPDVFLRCTTLVAHNADMFDKLVWEEKVSRKPVEWVDTIHRARACGLRGSLDELGKQLLGKGKDEIGNRILHKCMKLPNKHTLPGNVGLITSYCIADVMILEELYERLPPITTFDVPVLRASNIINNRGVRFDGNLAQRIIQWSEEESEEAKGEIKRLIGDINLRSPVQMHAWLRENGITLPNTKKETVERFLNEPEEYSEVEVPADVFRVLELRKSAIRITGSKLAGALANMQSDGRVRDGFVYHGAGPGRFSGRRVQVQNLPRGVAGIDIPALVSESTDDVSEAKRLGVPRSAIHSALIRPCFTGEDLLIADFNAIECRVTAWLANEEKLLNDFMVGNDPYLTAASSIFGRDVTKEDKLERFIGKETVLQSGYQAGPRTFGNYLKNKRVTLPDGITPETCITAFRETYPNIVSLWYDLGRAAIVTLLTGTVSHIAKCTIYRDEDGLKIQLPSTRVLYYRKPRMEKVPAPWDPGQVIDQIIYESPRGRKSLYGGKILENMAQGIARDLLCVAMCKCEERDKLPIVMHVHDELVGEGHKDRGEELARIMSEGAEWSRGLPLAVEWHSSPRYVKNPWPGYPHGEVKGAN